MELNIMDFLKEGYIIVIVALYVIGIFLKKMETIKDKYIVVILNGILQGILCWGVSVGVNQLKVQASKIE